MHAREVKIVSKFDQPLADADGWRVNMMIVLVSQHLILRFPDISWFRQYQMTLWDELNF